jgi:hypothetical protein
MEVEIKLRAEMNEIQNKHTVCRMIKEAKREQRV